MNNKNILATLGLALVLSATALAQGTLTGAGATFPAPLYNAWAQEYKAAGGAQINYQAIGSGGGIKNITAKSVDFGATDGPMTPSELQKAPGILHIPMAVGAVVPAYNVPGAPANLKLTGSVIADIYLGKVKTWNDAAIAKLNPGVNLPGLRIVPVSRADSSGTTAIFTSYLAKVSPAFLAQVGEGKAVNFTVGVKGKGNDGVAALVRQTPGGFGYIEQAYADKNKISHASVQNAKGKFIQATLASTSESVSTAKLPADFRAMITNTGDAEGYPITGFTWILIYSDAKPEVKKFLKWALTSGQKSATKYDYAPLPESVRTRALKVVEGLK